MFLKRCQRESGFTLIELLVVISIIGVLASLLLPVLAKAKAKVKMAQSANNLKQIRLGIKMWSDGMFDGQNPEYYGRPGWKPSVGGQKWDQWDNFWMHKSVINNGNNHKILKSPFTVEINQSGTLTWPSWGSANTCWKWPNNYQGINDGKPFSGSYAFNGWQHPNMKVDDSKWDWLYQNDSEGQPDMAPMLVDSIWVDVWPEESDVPAKTWKGSRISMMSRVSMDRHDGRNLVVFNDGHVEAIKLPMLWTLHWHKNWETPSLLPEPPVK